MPLVTVYQNSSLNISLPINLASRTVFRFYTADNNSNNTPLTGFTSANFVIYPEGEDPVDTAMQVNANGDVILTFDSYWWTFGQSVNNCAIFLDNDYVAFVSGTVAFGIVMQPNQAYAIMNASRNAVLVNGVQYENPRYVDSATALFEVSVDSGTGVATVTVNTAGGTWYSGTGVPSNGLGADGSFYFDTQNYDLYGPKASGVWPTPVSFVTDQDLIDALLTKQDVNNNLTQISDATFSNGDVIYKTAGVIQGLPVADLPVSTPTSEALELKQDTADKGQPNGYAPLDSNSLVPEANLPMFSFPVTSVFGRTGAVVAQSGDYTKADVGLSNVDNTSDATKNAAIATLTNKTLTAPVINSPTGLVKADVGLSNVPNVDATDAANISSGVFADARVQQSNVTQHQAALTIAQSQVTNLVTDLAGKAASGANTDITSVLLDNLGLQVHSELGGPQLIIVPDGEAYTAPRTLNLQLPNADRTLSLPADATVSGVNTGDNANTAGNAGTATAWATGRTVAITGDLAYTSPSIDGTANVTAAGTLATVNSNVGSFGSATEVPAITVNGKGLVTAVVNTAIAIAQSAVTNLVSDLASKQNAISFAQISDTKAANTAGGTFTSGSFLTRTLQTEDWDPDGIVSISTNQFTLQAGTYQILASAPAAVVDQHKTKLRNITDSIDTILGTSEYAASAAVATSRSFVQGFFTIAGAKAFEIQHRCTTTKATDGFGVQSNFGVSEVYTIVQIWKIG